MGRMYYSYRRKAQGRHDVHSPFVYEFIESILRKSRKARSIKVENERLRLKRSIQTIEFKDYGKSGNIFEKTVSDIAKKSLKPTKYGRLLGRICQKQQMTDVLELGTSLGITTSYLARNAKNVVTMEGSSKVVDIAKSVWGQLGLKNIEVITGNFDQTLDQLKDKKFDLIFMDGNHQLKPTLRYFKQLLNHTHTKSYIVVDDINWSPDMQQAWKEIKANEKVTVSIDLFALGIVFIDPDLSKQEFILKY